MFVAVKMDILHTRNRRKANCIGHTLRRNWLLKQLTEGKIEGKRRGGRRGKQISDESNKKRRYWKLKKIALNRTV
jgi:hypothetical protein